MIDHVTLARDIHADNVAAGWWTDLRTGESILATRNRPELMMLIVSEIAEAKEGWVGDLKDDKLPQYPMFDVELADVAIRIYDLLGAEGWDGEGIELCDWKFAHMSATRNLLELTCLIAAAMEGYRKGNRDKFIMNLVAALVGVYATAEERCFVEDLDVIIEAKRSFNRNRLDHKIENRKAVGGKAF